MAIATGNNKTSITFDRKGDYVTIAVRDDLFTIHKSDFDKIAAFLLDEASFIDFLNDRRRKVAAIYPPVGRLKTWQLRPDRTETSHA